MYALSISLLILLFLTSSALAYSYATVRQLNRKNGELSASKDQIEQKLSKSTAEMKSLAENLAHSQATIENLKHQIDTFSKQREIDESRFTQLAKETLGKEFASIKSESEGRLLELLVPFREQINAFKNQVAECYSMEARERFALKSEVERLLQQSQTIGKEAQELSNALRGNTKAQGDWGEMILEGILEQSGLRKGVEFVLQQTRDTEGNLLKGENGKALRPDAVVYYPGGRAVVVDSKVSLTAFAVWANAETKEQQEAAARKHVESVRAHIAELSNKRYEDYVSRVKLDFVLMFIPNESAYISAMSLEPMLWQEAYDKRVLIVSPTHLVSVLRIVEQLWSRDKQTRNAVEIAEKAGKMYDKFVGLVNAMGDIQKGLNSTQKAFDTAMGRLQTGNGNLMSKAEELRHLGAKTRATLSVDDDNPILESDRPVR